MVGAKGRNKVRVEYTKQVFFLFVHFVLWHLLLGWKTPHPTNTRDANQKEMYIYIYVFLNTYLANG